VVHRVRDLRTRLYKTIDLGWRQGTSTYWANPLKDLGGGEALLPEALIVAAAGRRVADDELGRVELGQVRHDLRHLQRVDPAQRHASQHDSGT
jgi:hypothetical protein